MGLIIKGMGWTGSGSDEMISPESPTIFHTTHIWIILRSGPTPPANIQRSQPKRCGKFSFGSTEFWRDRYEGLSSYNSPIASTAIWSAPKTAPKMDFFVFTIVKDGKKNPCLKSAWFPVSKWPHVGKKLASSEWKYGKKKYGNPTIFSRLIVTQASEAAVVAWDFHGGYPTIHGIPGPRWLLWYCGWNPAPMVETQTK